MGSSYLSHEICQRIMISFLKFRSTGEKEAYSSLDDTSLCAKSFLFISEEGWERRKLKEKEISFLGVAY